MVLIDIDVFIKYLVVDICHVRDLNCVLSHCFNVLN